jgi:hypothetical protein
MQHAPLDHRTLTLAAIAREMAFALPEGDEAREEVLAYLVANGLSGPRLPAASGEMPVEEVLRGLLRVPAHAGTDDPGTVTVDRAGFWTLVACAGRAAALLGAMPATAEDNDMTDAPIAEFIREVDTLGRDVDRAVKDEGVDLAALRTRLLAALEVDPGTDTAALDAKARLHVTVSRFEKALVRPGRFGHHFEPAQDFITEVDAITAVFEAFSRGETVDRAELDRRVDRALDFTVGGVPEAVVAKDRLRGIADLLDKAARQASRFGHDPDPQQDFVTEVEELVELQVLAYTGGAGPDGNPVDVEALERRIASALAVDLTGLGQLAQIHMAILEGIAARHREAKVRRRTAGELAGIVASLAARLPEDDPERKKAEEYLATHDDGEVPFRSNQQKVSPERLAELTLRYSVMSSATARDVSSALIELSLRRSLDRRTGQKGPFQ